MGRVSGGVLSVFMSISTAPVMSTQRIALTVLISPELGETVLRVGG